MMCAASLQVSKKQGIRQQLQELISALPDRSDEEDANVDCSEAALKLSMEGNIEFYDADLDDDNDDDDDDGDADDDDDDGDETRMQLEDQKQLNIKEEDEAHEATKQRYSGSHHWM